jgi:pimeloyl-ACP methyl ester carboxylesterase
MKAVVVFQGFTESDASATGTEDLYFDVVRQFASKTVTTYQPRTWKTGLENLLDQLIRQRIHDVIVIGYSWGAGYASQKFARLAPDWGVKIPLMLLCDPVYRPLWMPTWLGANPLCLRSLLPKSTKIVVPQSVRRVCGVRQEISIPFGHHVTHASPVTKIEPFKVLPYSHTTIDGAPEWFSLVRNELEFELRPEQ